MCIDLRLRGFAGGWLLAPFHGYLHAFSSSQLSTSHRALASSGKVVTWGSSSVGGDSSSAAWLHCYVEYSTARLDQDEDSQISQVREQLTSVRQLFGFANGFAAIRRLAMQLTTQAISQQLSGRFHKRRCRRMVCSRP